MKYKLKPGDILIINDEEYIKVKTLKKMGIIITNN